MTTNLPLNALRVFEAASRHLNLLRASEELRITQSAVSRHIQRLEQSLGVALFVRGPRGLQFTEAGDILALHARRMFNELQSVTQQLGGERSRRLLRIAVARSYASRVLVRHIGEFIALHPWIDLHLDGMRHMSDLHRGEADAAIRVGDGEWPELQVDCLGEEHLTPVCSPKVLQTAGPFNNPNELSRVTLLHFSEQPQWRRWLAAAGADQVDPSTGVKFSETVMALEAAQASQGFACARVSLVAEELASGVLVRPFDLTIPDNQRYYFCATERAANRNHVTAFRSWLLELSNRLRKQQSLS